MLVEIVNLTNVKNIILQISNLKEIKMIEKEKIFLNDFDDKKKLYVSIFRDSVIKKYLIHI